MNALYSGKLPQTVTVEGVEYPIKCGFKDVLEIAAMLSDPEVPDSARGDFAVRMFYIICPDNFYEALEAMKFFFSGGRKEILSDFSNPVFDFEADAELIYAAFFETYGIDLSSSDMHWWKFRALFSGLSSETEFMRVVGIRSFDSSDVTDPERKAQIRKMKARYALR